MFSPEMMKAAQNMMANMSPEQMAQMYIFYHFCFDVLIFNLLIVFIVFQQILFQNHDFFQNNRLRSQMAGNMDPAAMQRMQQQMGQGGGMPGSRNSSFFSEKHVSSILSKSRPKYVLLLKFRWNRLEILFLHPKFWFWIRYASGRDARSGTNAQGSRGHEKHVEQKYFFWFCGVPTMMFELFSTIFVSKSWFVFTFLFDFCQFFL